VRTALSLAIAALLALIGVCLVWELWLAPLRPGGSWAVLKTLPLLTPLHGMLRGRRYTAQWSSMLLLAYLAEGVVRAWSEPGPVRPLAALEIVLAGLYVTAAVIYARQR
jgi:uncharacterized membrane protein